MVQGMQADADQSAHQRAVDADVLQVAADIKLEFLCNGVRIPFLDHAPHQSCNNVAASRNRICDE